MRTRTRQLARARAAAPMTLLPTSDKGSDDPRRGIAAQVTVHNGLRVPRRACWVFGVRSHAHSSEGTAAMSYTVQQARYDIAAGEIRAGALQVVPRSHKEGLLDLS